MGSCFDGEALYPVAFLREGFRFWLDYGSMGMIGYDLKNGQDSNGTS